MTSFSKGGSEDQTYTHLDLSGKLIIKAQLGDDVRRIPIHNEAITYDELVLMMQRVFRGKLSSSDEILLKYKDEDGDLVTIFDSSDLAFAVQYSRILKLQVLVGGEAALRTKGLPPSQVSTVRKELQEIRDRVNYLLDTIEPRTVEVTSSTSDSRTGQHEMNNPNPNISSREFDPLQQAHQKAAESGQVVKEEVSQQPHPPVDGSLPDGGRGSTPDSLGSAGSRRVSSAFPDNQQSTPQPPPQTGFQPINSGQPQQMYQSLPPDHQQQQPQQQQQQQQQPPLQQQQQQQPQQGGQPQQPFQPQNYPRYPVAFVGGPVMGQQQPPPHMMVQGASGQQPGVPQNAYQPSYQYPSVQTYAGAPQSSGGPPAVVSGASPGPRPQQGPQSFSGQEYGQQQGGYMQPRFMQQSAAVGGNPYSKGSAYNRPSSQPGYQ
ncbi:protein TFG-like [Schistocerca gregaria]|uniref:protein TFG-like n=1 Tax=Schistocerca gregaria TaxID=7010 RepID=UPI00211EB1D4|nr:protein TFG-like [Schistocerca gregaria]